MISLEGSAGQNTTKKIVFAWCGDSWLTELVSIFRHCAGASLSAAIPDLIMRAPKEENQSSLISGISFFVFWSDGDFFFRFGGSRVTRVQASRPVYRRSSSSSVRLSLKVCIKKGIKNQALLRLALNSGG